MGWKLGRAPLLTVATLLLPQPALADTGWKTSSSVWKIYDACTKQALKQFPDYTATSNANREKARQNCLRASNLPVEGSSVPPPPQPAPGQH